MERRAWLHVFANINDFWWNRGDSSW